MSTRKIGGVGRRRLVRPAAAAPAGPAYPDLIYNGGPVIACPNVYASFWGAHWSDSTHLPQSQRLSQFLQDLVASEWMNVLSQYGAGSGAKSGLFMQTSYIANVPAVISDTQIHTVIQAAINTGSIPEPPANNTSHVIVIFLDESVSVNDQSLGIVMCATGADDTAFGYHWSFVTTKGNNCYYAVIPCLDDNCLTNSCGDGSDGCTLTTAMSLEQRRTQVASHEFAEMLTDPLFEKGWFGASSDEIGDICNGEGGTITAGANTWTIQRIYSKTDDIQTNGATVCLPVAAVPIPRLPNGPAPLATTAQLSPDRYNAYRPFLPLPTSRFDAAASQSSWDEDHVQSYVRNVFYPLHFTNLFSNMPGTLRNFADILEKPAPAGKPVNGRPAES